MLPRTVKQTESLFTATQINPEEKRMYIMDDGIRLNAKLDMPESHGEKCPLVIVIHGFTGHMEEDHIVGVSRAMNEIGFATLRAEMYGHGGSDGAFHDHTLFKWIGNAMAVTDYARSLDFVTDLYLSGHSQGGLVAALAGGMFPDHVRGLILRAPAFMIPRGAREGSMLGRMFDPLHVPDEIEVRTGAADVTGKICVIGAGLKGAALAELFKKKRG